MNFPNMKLFAMERRRVLWPLLTCCSKEYSNTQSTDQESPKLREMALLDVNRINYLLQDIPEEDRQEIKDAVLDIILRVLTSNRHLRYYQGYHEVVTVIYLLLRDKEIAYEVMSNLTLSRFSQFMDSDFTGTIRAIKMVENLLRVVDNELYRTLISTELSFNFTMASLITWFAHTAPLRSLPMVFDYIIYSDSYTTPIYLVVASLCGRRDELISLSFDQEFLPKLYRSISTLPGDVDIDVIIKNARKFELEYPDLERLGEKDLVVERRMFLPFSVSGLLVLGAAVIIYYFFSYK